MPTSSHPHTQDGNDDGGGGGGSKREQSADSKSEEQAQMKYGQNDMQHFVLNPYST